MEGMLLDPHPPIGLFRIYLSMFSVHARMQERKRYGRQAVCSCSVFVLEWRACPSDFSEDALTPSATAPALVFFYPTLSNTRIVNTEGESRRFSTASSLCLHGEDTCGLSVSFLACDDDRVPCRKGRSLYRSKAVRDRMEPSNSV